MRLVLGFSVAVILLLAVYYFQSSGSPQAEMENTKATLQSSQRQEKNQNQLPTRLPGQAVPNQQDQPSNDTRAETLPEDLESVSLPEQDVIEPEDHRPPASVENAAPAVAPVPLQTFDISSPQADFLFE